MKTRIHTGALALALLTLSGAALGQVKASAEVQRSATSWLALVDGGNYAQSWEAASSYFKSKVTKDQWVSEAGQVRVPLGEVKSRRLTSVESLKNPPNAPPGDYVREQYTTSYAKLAAAIETLALIKEKDGQWRVIGYFIKPN